MNARRIDNARVAAAAAVREDVRDDVARRVTLRIVAALLVIAVALALLLVPSPAEAVDTGAEEVAKQTASNVVHIVGPGKGKVDLQQADCYLVPEGETREIDLYIWARCLEINGVLDGDIVAGFQDGVINGTVTQDLNGGSNTMAINGTVGDDVRFACETFTVDGYIGGDLIVAARDVRIGEGAVVEGDVIIASATANIYGRIGGRARIMTGFVNLDGTIDGNAEITTDGGISFGENAHVGGDLYYEGPTRIDVPPSAVAGEVTYTQITSSDDIDIDTDFLEGAGFFLHFIGFIMALVAGTIIVALTPDHARRTAEVMRTKPLKSLGIGFVTYICMPLVLLLLLVLILTIPLMFVVGLAYAIALYIAKFYFSIWIGNLILSRGGRDDVSPIPSMLLGLLLVYIVTAIPFIGTLAGIVIIFFGLGALMQRKETKLDVAFESAPQPVSNGLPTEFTGTGSGE